MTIPLTGSGSLFVRLGHLLGGVSDVNALRGGPLTARVLSGARMPDRVISPIDVDYANGTPLPQVLEGIQAAVTGFVGGAGGICTDFRSRAINTLLAMYALDQQGVSADASLTALTSGFSLQQAMSTLISQMLTATTGVTAATVSAGSQTAVGTPNGNPIIVVSLKNNQAVSLQLCFPETLTFKCTNDAQGSATLGNEPLQVTGQAAVQDTLAPLWPGGSGVNVSLNAVNGAANNSQGNLLQNSDFFVNTTANVPDNFTIQVGVAGTDVFVDTANAYTTGGGSLRFLGTGSALLDAVTQSFNTTPVTTVGAGGTLAKLAPATVYHVNGWCKCSATPAAGVLEFALIDGSAYPGTVMQDAAGGNNLFTKSLTAVSTSYVNFNGVFRTPNVMPATTPYKLRVRLSTAIDSGKSVYVGRLSMTPVAPNVLYPGGPFVSVHSGNTALINGVAPDTWTVSVSNSYATSGTGLWAFWFERLFGMRALGLQLPIGQSTTILDSLIV